MDEEQKKLIQEELIRVNHYLRKLEEHILRLEYYMDFATSPYVVM
jgi:hypothetical protein